MMFNKEKSIEFKLPPIPERSKILPAKDALEKTKETHLKAIESYILAAIEKGQTCCEIMPSQQFISQENQQILKDAGYTVTEKESMAGKEIKISWE